jgi:phosphate transport system protein
MVRESYHERLDLLLGELAVMCDMTCGALRDATTALLHIDAPMAEQTISRDRQIDRARTTCERHAYTLLALQAPVASELRMIVSAALAAENLERMGDLARHIAELVLRRSPAGVVPEELRPAITDLHQHTSIVAEVASRVIRAKDAALAGFARTLDDFVDQRHRELLRMVTHPAWRHGLPTAVDTSLLGRYYERFADHAVILCERMSYVLTGEPPDTDADGPPILVA